MNLLLINPWIYDFAAYDLWGKPLGFLYIAALLRKAGYSISYIDCLDRHYGYNEEKPYDDKHFGCGKYHTEEIPRPDVLRFVPRKYKRYGIDPDHFRSELEKTRKPHGILITSRMTYWYHGVADIIKICRSIFGSIPIILGGTYPILMPKHAREHSGADFVIPGEGEIAVFKVLKEALKVDIEAPLQSLDNLDALPLPAFDVYKKLDYIVVQSSRGCPHCCTYCASHHISPIFRRRSPAHVVDEIIYWEKKHGIRDFVFYDDALLYEAEQHFMIILEEYISRGGTGRFHTPNGLDCSAITKDMAQLMKRAGFKTLRLSLETASCEQLKRLRRHPASVEHLRNALRYLANAGFSRDEMGVYLLAGLPDQSLSEVIESVKIVLAGGGMPRIAEYSPIPKTQLWTRACEIIKPLDLEQEPLYHNNSVFYRLLPDFKDDPLPQIRNFVRKRVAI